MAHIVSVTSNPQTSTKPNQNVFCSLIKSKVSKLDLKTDATTLRHDAGSIFFADSDLTLLNLTCFYNPKKVVSA